MSGQPYEPYDPTVPSDDGPMAWAPDGFIVPPRRPKYRDRIWVHVLLLALTALTTTLTGGLAYSVTVLLILGSHEMGHYLACRYYQVDASLPFFLPSPFFFGTFGAVIRIREPIPTRQMVFDIGAAGPFAGFLVAVPALVLGVSLSEVQVVPPDYPGLTFGDPLLLQAVSWLFFGPIPEGSALFVHPIALASWLGLLVTALNLFPVGQLDGGHISYAVLGRRSTTVTLLMVGVTICLAVFVSVSWTVWTLLLLLMLFLVGPRHPRTVDEDRPIDSTRRWIALAAIIMFALCFTHNPIQQ